MTTLAHRLEESAASYPDRVAFIARDRETTYRELDDLASRIAGGLAERGIGQGDRVAVMTGSHPEYVATFYGIWKLGAIGVALNAQLGPEEVLHQLTNSGARLAIADDGRPREVLEQVEGDASDLEAILPIGEPQGEPRTAVDIPDSAEATIFYTSGTTGVPKGAVHTHRALRVQLDMVAEWYSITDEEMFLSVLPLYLLSIFILGPMLSIHTGNTCRIMAKYKPLEFARNVKADQTTMLPASVPLMFQDLAELPEEQAAEVDLSSIRVAGCGGSPMPPEIRRVFEDRYDFSFIHAYGGTEGPAVVSTDPMDGRDRKFDSVGVPLPHIEVTIEDDDGNELSNGEVGEICTSAYDEGTYAGLYEPMAYYWDMPDETERALRGGKLHWGDLGRLDDDGFLYMVDRKKDMIIRGGMNVYPKELEKLLYEDDRIEECAVVGASHRRYGEVPVVFVRLAEGAAMSEEQVLALVNDRTAQFKHVQDVTFVEDFPRNALGKILKRELRTDLDPVEETAAGA